MSEKPLEGDGDPAKTPVSKKTCDNCKKKNSVQVYLDGGERCFTKGCGHKIIVTPEEREAPPAIPRGLLRPGDNAWASLSGRAIESATLRKYGTFMAGFRGGMALVTPIYSGTGEMVGQIARAQDGQNTTIAASDERVDPRSAQLYGHQVYGDRSDRKVVILSDGLDAMTVGQITRFKVPAVAVACEPKDAAMRVKADYRWLDRYGEIVLFFQAGDDWDAAAQQCAALFDAGKVKIARLESDFPSPNAALKAHRGGDVDQAIWAASTWRPRGIVNAAEGRDALFEEGLQTPSWPYPWDSFNELTMGMRPGECTYHIGGTGIAKTTLMIHYIVNLLKWDGKEFLPNGFPVQPKTKIGWMGFEDLTKQLKVAMLGIHAGRMLSLEDISKDEGVKLHDSLFGSGELELYDPEQAEYGLEAVLGYSRYLRRALDCRIQVLDPLTFLVSQLPAANRTQEEDRLAGRLAAEAKALGVHYHIGYHLKKPTGETFEEGAPISISDMRGSGALTHFAHNVIAYERNQQGSRPDLLRVRWLKNRVARFTGVGCILKYDMDTGRYTPTTDKWPSDKEDKESSNGDASGFAPVKDY